MEDFRCIQNKFVTVKDGLTEIHDLMTDTYQKAVKLKLAMDDVNIWDGEAHLVAMAFADLTLQYHGLLAEQGEDPIKQACEAMEKYLDADDVFYDEWEDYQEILKI